MVYPAGIVKRGTFAVAYPGSPLGTGTELAGGQSFAASLPDTSRSIFGWASQHRVALLPQSHSWQMLPNPSAPGFAAQTAKWRA
jgi:hypothetical protein